MAYGYYPGCSLSHSAAPYDLSTRAVAAALGLELRELDDWNCCGATEYIALNRTAAYALVGRNLALAEAQLAPEDGRPRQLVAPCSACFLNLRKVDSYVARHAELRGPFDAALAAGGLRYDAGSVVVRHLLETLVTDAGLEAIRKRVSHPLTGLRVAPYYGCLITRPDLTGRGGEDLEYPTSLDDLLRVMGAEVVDFPLKTHCCGGHMTQISAETAYSLIHRLLRSAAEYRADLIAAACPMCQLNLDAYQSAVNKAMGSRFEIPVLYFTQLMGLALGLPAEALGLGREMVPAREALAKIGVSEPLPPAPASSPAPPRPAHRKKGDKSLPMPAGPKAARSRKGVPA